MLYEAELIPQLITPAQFFEITSKIKPLTLTANTNNALNKEVMFYTLDTISAYMRDHANSPEHIKTIEGDIGLTFLEFSILIIRIATEYCKENKNDFPVYLSKFLNNLKVRECFQIVDTPLQSEINQLKKTSISTSVTRLQSSVILHLKNQIENSRSNKLPKNKKESKHQI